MDRVRCERLGPQHTQVVLTCAAEESASLRSAGIRFNDWPSYQDQRMRTAFEPDSQMTPHASEAGRAVFLVSPLYLVQKWISLALRHGQNCVRYERVRTDSIVFQT